MKLAGAAQIVAFAFTPERAWRHAAAATSEYPMVRHLGVLALLPALTAAILATHDGAFVSAAALTPLAQDAPFALALGDDGMTPAIPITPLAENARHLDWPAVAALAYFATWLAVASAAAILNLLLPLFSARRNFRRTITLVSCAATPLLLASLALLHPSLAGIVALAAIHACYVAYVGLPPMLGVPRAEAGVCLGVTAIAALVFGQVAGYVAGMLVTLLAS